MLDNVPVTVLTFLGHPTNGSYLGTNCEPAEFRPASSVSNVANRLTAQEVSLLALDTQHNPGHVGTVDIFEADADFDFESLVALIRERIAYVPRYRMRVRHVPGGLAAPVWVEDEEFDLTYHVRRSGLPRPGTHEQLREFVGRVMARRLDHSRPLWEMYLVEGLEGDRIALITKTHLLLVDGDAHVDIGHVLLDEEPTDPDERPEPAEWEPVPEPSEMELAVQALFESAVEPWNVVRNVRRGVTAALGAAVAVGEALGGVGGTVGDLAATALRGSRAPSDSPLVGVVSEQRRIATVDLDLDRLRRLRVAHNCTINDVVLAVLTGALRDWLAARGEITSRAQLTALVPMSVVDEQDEPSSLGSQVAPHLMSLPIGEPNALMRLHQVSYGTKAHKETGRAVAASAIADIAGFAPTTLHALGVRVAGEVVRRQHDLVITNVPGPQRQLYAGGSPMLASYPIQPLDAGHLLAVGVTSYNGRVFIGLTGDRFGMPDLDVLAQCIEEALDELAETIAEARQSRQPTRAASRAARPRKRPATRVPTSQAEAQEAVDKVVRRVASGARKTAATKRPAQKTPPKKAPAKRAVPEKTTPKKAAGQQSTPDETGSEQP